MPGNETAMTNTKILFKSIPTGNVDAKEHFEIKKEPFNLDSVTLRDGQVLIKTLTISLDPYMRGRMRPENIKSYSPAFKLGEPLTAGGIGVVIKSASEKYSNGDIVSGFVQWAEYCVLSDSAIETKVDPKGKFKPDDYLGLLGMPSLTAYTGLVTIGQPKKGETLYVSSAAGAVGQMAGQMGKAMGLRVVGSAGSDAKVEKLRNEMGFDAAFNYKTQDIRKSLSEHCPNGIDIYFENVGGKMLEDVLFHMNDFGRIPVCGMISQYNNEQYGVKNLTFIITKRLKLQGFIVSDHSKDDLPKFLKFMNEQGSKFNYETTVAEGIENGPDAFIGMLNGKNVGKQLLVVSKL